MPDRNSTVPATAVAGLVNQRLAAVEPQNTVQRLTTKWVIAGSVAGGLVDILIGLVIAGVR